MKFIWEAIDIVAGQRVGKFNRNETWMIGYDPADQSPSKWACISNVDGMISKMGLTKSAMADHLNATGDYPVEMFAMMKRADDEETEV